MNAAEIQRILEAKQKIKDEWDKLRLLQTWDEDKVCEYEAARKRALENGREAHVGRLFAFCVEKNTLSSHHQNAPIKGELSFRAIKLKKNAEGLAAVFSELGTSASLMPTSKLVDAVAMLPGCSGEQSDAVQAYTQALLYHGQKRAIETWIRFPRDQW